MGKKSKAFSRIVFSVVAVTAALVSTAALPVAAVATQTNPVANGFQISPVLVEPTINKGQSLVVPLTISNPTNFVGGDEFVVDDFTASTQENGTPRLLLNGAVADPRHNFKSLVSPISNITIPSKGSANVNVVITVPSDANSGGYYGTVRLVPAGTPSGGGNVGLTASVGTLFLVTVPGNLVEKLDLVQLSAAENGSASSLIFSGVPQVLTRLSNVGDIHVIPFGKVNVTDMFGKVVDSYEFNSTQGNILPNSTRKFVDNLPKRSWLGHYTIQISLAYSNGSGNIITATAGFWYFPLWFVIVAAVVVIIIVTLIYRLVLHFKKPSPRRRN
jgi:hypothetical protein